MVATNLLGLARVEFLETLNDATFICVWLPFLKRFGLLWGETSGVERGRHGETSEDQRKLKGDEGGAFEEHEDERSRMDGLLYGWSGAYDESDALIVVIVVAVDESCLPIGSRIALSQTDCFSLSQSRDKQRSRVVFLQANFKPPSHRRLPRPSALKRRCIPVASLLDVVSLSWISFPIPAADLGSWRTSLSNAHLLPWTFHPAPQSLPPKHLQTPSAPIFPTSALSVLSISLQRTNFPPLPQQHDVPKPIHFPSQSRPYHLCTTQTQWKLPPATTSSC